MKLPLDYPSILLQTLEFHDLLPILQFCINIAPRKQTTPKRFGETFQSGVHSKEASDSWRHGWIRIEEQRGRPENLD